MYWYQRHRNPRSDDIWEKMLGAAHATDPELAQWMEDNAPTLKQMVADKISASETPDIPVYTEMESVARPPRSEIRREDMPLEEVAEDYVVVTRPTVETLEGAKAWVREAAQMLAELPVPREPTNIIGYEGRTPIHDGIGLSGSTAGPIRKFAAMLPQDGDEDLPIDVYRAALEYLRSHSRSQLNRASFDEALDIISSEDAALDIEAAKDLLKSGVLGFSSKGGSTTEGGWEINDAGEISIDKEYKRNFKVSHDAIQRGTGLNKGQDYYFKKMGYDDWRLVVRPHALETFLSWFQQGYPHLTATIYPYLEELTAPPEGQQGVTAIPWELDTDQFRLLLDVSKANWQANNFAYEFNQIPKWVRRDDGIYWSNISLEDLPAFRALLAEKRGAFWEALLEEVDANIDEWMSHKASLKQTKEEGYAPGGRWKRLPNNKFVVRTDYLQKIRGFKNTYPGGDQPIRFEVSEKRMPKLADALRPHHPRLAEAITRAFGGVAQIGEDLRRRDLPLVDHRQASLAVNQETGGNL